MKHHDKTTQQLAHAFKLMRSAFLDYDMSKNIQVNEAQAEILSYLPFDEIGHKVEFLLSNPATSQAIAKYLLSTLKPSKTHNTNVNDIITHALPLMFTVGLRAHMSLCTTFTNRLDSWKVITAAIFKHTQLTLNRKRPRGWYRVPCPAALRPFMERKLLPVAAGTHTALQLNRWSAALKTNFKNAGHSYFDHHCGQQESQGQWVEKRYSLRKKLLHKHMVRPKSKIKSKASCHGVVAS